MNIVASPAFERFHRAVIHPFWSWKDGHASQIYLDAFERSQYLSPEVIHSQQWIKLKKLLNHAWEHCPYYRGTWTKEGIHPEDVRSFTEFSKLPILEKRHIQDNQDGLRSRAFPLSDLVSNLTGGSTGEPLRFYMDKQRVCSRAASTIRHDRWAGKDVGVMGASIWGHPRDLARGGRAWWNAFKDRFIYRTVNLDASRLDEAYVKAFIEACRRDRPKVFVAYANAVHLLARMLRDMGVSDFPRPISIITTAEHLEPSRRALIEEVFSCPVFNRYGCRETSVIASECDRHDGMHVNAEAIFLEVITPEGPAAPGHVGEILITDLLNLGFPLIRYRIKDLGALSPDHCSCGRGLPLMHLEGGRVTDFLVTPSGRAVSGAALTIMLTAKVPGVRRMQLAQDSVDRVEFRVVRGDGYENGGQETIRRVAEEYLGEGVRLDFRYMDDIPPSPSGKHLFCISTLDYLRRP